MMDLERFWMDLVHAHVNVLVLLLTVAHGDVLMPARHAASMVRRTISSSSAGSRCRSLDESEMTTWQVLFALAL